MSSKTGHKVKVLTSYIIIYYSSENPDQCWKIKIRNKSSNFWKEEKQQLLAIKSISSLENPRELTENLLAFMRQSIKGLDVR